MGSTPTRPPCAATTVPTIASPRPAAPISWRGSPWAPPPWNPSSNTRARSSSGMPPHESSTATRTCPSARDAATRTTPPGRAAAHRVAHEVVEHPRQLVGHADHLEVRRHVDEQGHAVRRRHGRGVRQHVVQHRAQLDRLRRAGRGHGVGPRQLGEVVDHPAQPLHGGTDPEVGGLRVRDDAVAQAVDGGADAGQRRAQVVAHERDDLAAGGLQGPLPLAGGRQAGPGPGQLGRQLGDLGGDGDGRRDCGACPRAPAPGRRPRARRPARGGPRITASTTAGTDDRPRTRRATAASWSERNMRSDVDPDGERDHRHRDERRDDHGGDERRASHPGDDEGAERADADRAQCRHAGDEPQVAAHRASSASAASSSSAVPSR